MKMPELVLIAGCNAAGKSTFIRTRLNELETFEVIMTNVYQCRTKELALKYHRIFNINSNLKEISKINLSCPIGAKYGSKKIRSDAAVPR